VGPLYIHPLLLAFLIILLLAFIAFATIWSIRAHRRKVSSGKEELIGSTAIVETPLNPKGTVFIKGELWNAVLDSGSAQPGEEVIITSVNGLKLQVKKK